MRQHLACLIIVLAFFLSPTLNAAQATTSTQVIDARIERLDLPITAPATDARFRNKLKQYLRSPRGTARILGRSATYFPVFDRVFCELDLPAELKYIAVVESTLNPRAVSNRGAAGLWQLMPATGRSLGLRVDGVVDERLDPEKSTYAAARMLQELYADFGDWHLVVAAYNAGPGRLRSALRRAGTDADYLTVKRFLPRETRNYVANYVAAAYIFNYHGSHGVATESYVQELTVAFPVYRSRSLSALARLAGVKYLTLKRLNPSLIQGYVPASRTGFALNVPAASLETLELNLWGKPNLVYTDDYSVRMDEVALAEIQGLDASKWLTGAEHLIGYAPGPAYHTLVHQWSQAWIEESATLAYAG